MKNIAESLAKSKKQYMVVFDLVAITCAYIISIVFLKSSLADIPALLKELLLMIVLFELFLHLFKVYDNMAIYEQSTDYVKYLYAGIIIFVITSVSSRFFVFHYIGLRVNTLSCMISSGIMIIYRLVIRFYFSNRNQKVETKDVETKRNLLIVGAGLGAKEIIISINTTMRNKYNIIGLVDDDLSKLHKRILDVEVLGNRYNIPQIVKEKNVDLIFVAIHNITNQSRKELVEICQQTNIKTQILPSTEEIINKNGALSSLRDVEIEDLLGRDPIKLDNKDIGNLIKNKVVMVTGGGGSIGSELCRQIMSYEPKQLVIFDIYENTTYDIELELKRKYDPNKIKAIIGSMTDKKMLEEVFGEYKPNLVFHAAAHKHVPLMETVPLEAIKNNIFGTYNVVNCADKFGVQRFILVSTDKAVNPTNVMGATKRMCEMIVQAKNKVSKTEYCAVRFGNVLGSNGSVIPLFRKQIAEGGPVTVTHKEITRFFMTIPEAVSLILQAITYAAGGEIFVLDMGKPVKIYDLAVSLIKLSGFEPDVDIPIKVTGLRPGEKLYEELLMNEEGLSKTAHGKIFVSEPSNITMEEVEDKLKILSSIDYDDDYSALKAKQALKQAVPTFREPEEINNKVKNNG